MNELMLPENMPIAQYDESVLQDLSKTGDWIPRICVTGSNTDLVKEGKLSMGVVASIHSKDNFKDLGKQVDMILVAWRPRALRMPVGGTPISYYVLTDPEFVKIQNESYESESRCVYGPEFLVWVPSEQSFGLFHLNSKSSRKEGNKCLAAMKDEVTGKLRPGAVTLKGRFVKTPKYSWWTPDVVTCSTPLSPLPSQEDLIAELTKFNNPPKVITPEKAEPVGTRER